MSIRLVVTLLCLFSWGASAFDHSHAKWNEVLKKYRAADGRVHYKALKGDLFPGSSHALTDYLGFLSSVTKAEYNGWKKEEQMAFLINAYNALTFKLIVDHYPVKSIKDIGGLFQSPWKKEFFSLFEGKLKALDPLEHDYLRKDFGDARVHAALNCASLSCPKLQPRAFVAGQLNTQLDESLIEWLKDDSRNHFDSNANAMDLSKVFDWYKEDFVKSYGGVTQTLAKFGPPLAKSLVKTGARVKYLPYDWKLNEVPPTASKNASE